MTRRSFVGVAALALVAALVSAAGWRASAAGQRAPQVPVFEVDPTFFKVPSQWVLGQGSAVAVDRRDHVWIIHRPRYVPADKRSMAAPPVMEFDATGKFIQGWGGPSAEYDWPDQEHGIYVDEKDNVWITGSARPALAGPGDRVLRSDNMLLKFTTAGRLQLQIGRRDESDGNRDTRNVYSATDVFAYPNANEIFVADGYINRRVIVFNRDTGAFRRMWGAFGNVPVDPPDMLKNARTPPRLRGTPPPPAPAGTAAPPGRGSQPPADRMQLAQFAGPVHAVEISNDDRVYVADRSAGRVQVFTTDGKYLTQVAVEGASGIALSPEREQRFLYVVNMGGSKIVVLDRRTLDVLYQFGSRSPKPGDFQGVHHIAIDSKGNLYTAEAEPGNRFQRFVFKGLGPPPAAEGGR